MLDVSPLATPYSICTSKSIDRSSVMTSVTTLINKSMYVCTCWCMCMHLNFKTIFCKIIFCYYFSSHYHDKPNVLNKLCHSWLKEGFAFQPYTPQFMPDRQTGSDNTIWLTYMGLWNSVLHFKKCGVYKIL